MNISKQFENIGEYLAAGLFEEEGRSLFYRKALGLRRYYENVKLLPYNGELLYPSGVNKSSMVVQCNYVDGYLHGFSYDRKALAKNDEKLEALLHDVIGDQYYSEYIPEEHGVAGRMWTHSMPNYERILKEGFDSYEKRIAKIDDVDLREGLLHLVAGIRTYKDRCVSYLDELGADKKLINALKKVPFEPAETLYEAIVGWNFIMYLDSCDNLGCLASGLMEYYKGENIVDLLANLFDNFNVNLGWSMSLGVDYSPLTMQCLEAAKGKRRPMIELFVNEDTPDEVWNLALDVVKSGGGQPAFYNHDLYYKGFSERFEQIKKEDLKKFCGGGCTEMMLAGLSNVGSLDAGINLTLIMRRTIDKYLVTSETYDEFYGHYIDEVRKVVEIVTDGIYRAQRDRAKICPLPMRTLLIDDCIDKGIEYNNGGARYMWSIINFAGMINVIDSLLVVRDLVFESKKYSGAQMLELLEKNDEGFLKKAREHEHRFGIDDEIANELSYKVSNEIYSMLEDRKTYFGYGFLASAIQFAQSVYAGKKVGATPDGRTDGAPLCDSLTATMGKDTKGPTSLLKSVASLDLRRAIGTPVVNFTINPTHDNALLKSLISSYMKLGGMHLQITCASRKTLEDAYKNPEMHKNLVVRVGGYSEYFVNLDDEIKQEIIKRTIYA